jgi:hypothetical protein
MAVDYLPDPMVVLGLSGGTLHSSRPRNLGRSADADHSFHVPAPTGRGCPGRASERPHGLTRDELLKGPLKTVT